MTSIADGGLDGGRLGRRRRALLEAGVDDAVRDGIAVIHDRVRGRLLRRGGAGRARLVLRQMRSHVADLHARRRPIRRIVRKGVDDSVVAGFFFDGGSATGGQRWRRWRSLRRAAGRRLVGRAAARFRLRFGARFRLRFYSDGAFRRGGLLLVDGGQAGREIRRFFVAVFAPHTLFVVELFAGAARPMDRVELALFGAAAALLQRRRSRPVFLFGRGQRGRAVLRRLEHRWYGGFVLRTFVVLA